MARYKKSDQVVVMQPKRIEVGSIMKSYPGGTPKYDVILESGIILDEIPSAKSLAKAGIWINKSITSQRFNKETGEDD